MKLTLRKANAVQLGINDAIKGLKFDQTVKINEFQDVDQTLVDTAAKFMANVDRRQRLTLALKEIRQQVGSANNQAGIDVRLTEIAHLDKNIQFYTGLVGALVRADLAVVKGQLDKIRNNKDANSRLYGYNDHVETGLFSEQDLAVFKTSLKDMKKAKQKLQDEVLELNVRTEIELDETTSQLLADEGLV